MLKKTKYHASFLKWAGGKTNALPSLFSTMPQSGDVLIEPFVGSCTVALNTDFKKYILADINPDLITLFGKVKENPDQFRLDVQRILRSDNNTRERFISLRQQFNKSEDPYERSLLFVYLNRHCYNGLTRYNKGGGFNTSYGKYTSVYVPHEEIMFFAEKLKDAEFVVAGFADLIIPTAPSKGSVIYCDPPYLPANKTSNFTGYTREGFTLDDHRALNSRCKEWSHSRWNVFVSNSDTEMTTQCYSDKSNTCLFDVQRNISTNGQKREKAGEVLMHYQPKQRKKKVTSGASCLHLVA